MKKFAVLVVCLVTLGLTGCTTLKDRETVLEQLSKNGYISDDYVYEQNWCTNASPIPAVLSYSYVYKLPDDTRSEVLIHSKVSNKDNKNSNSQRKVYLSCFEVDITSDITVEEADAGDNSPYKCIKSDDSETTKVFLVQEKFLVFNYWKIYNQEEYNDRFDFE